jgi:hypothetical protein
VESQPRSLLSLKPLQGSGRSSEKKGGLLRLETDSSAGRIPKPSNLGSAVADEGGQLNLGQF